MGGYKFVLTVLRRLFNNDVDKQLRGPDTYILFAVDSCAGRSRKHWLVLLLLSIELSSSKNIVIIIIIIYYNDTLPTL